MNIWIWAPQLSIFRRPCVIIILTSFDINFIVFFLFQGGSSSSKEELTNDCGIIIATAESFLDNLINSVENGTVTIATLILLEEHADQFLKLGELHQNNKKVPISIKNNFRQRCSEKKAFLTVKSQLQCFINFSNIFNSGISMGSIISLYPYRRSPGHGSAL